MERRDAQQMMERETRVTYGAVPHALAGAAPAERTWRLAERAFLLRASGEHWFHYREGQGVRIERGPGADVGAEPLWLGGSVRAAIACINGLIPIHASAVAHDGAVTAFSGPSGAGKSTLIAGLGTIGLPMVCDDTLIVDPAGAGAPECLPGHKRLKLTAHALAMTGAEAHAPAGDDRGKFHAASPAGEADATLPLARIVFLAEGEPMRIEPLSGAERVRRLLTDHYTVDLLAAGLGGDAALLLATVAALAQRTEMALFVRPRDTARFRAGVRHVADYVMHASG